MSCARRAQPSPELLKAFETASPDIPPTTMSRSELTTVPKFVPSGSLFEFVLDGC